MHEVLTVQVGGYANLVGAHFWNLQKDQDGSEGQPDGTLFRRGQTGQGAETRMPRLLLFDHEDSLGALRTGGYVYRQDAYSVKEARKTVPWSGRVEVHCTERIVSRNQFLQDGREPGDWELAERQRGDGESGGGAAVQANGRACSSSWSEVVRTHYHPRSTVPVKLDGEAVATWRAEEDGDRLRLFMEECDAPQGLHLLADLSAPFLPLVAGCVREFHEEASSAGITCLAFDLQQHQQQEAGSKAKAGVQGVLDRIASAMAIKELVQADALVLPLGSRLSASEALPGLDPSEWGHTSGLMACALDVATGIYCGAGPPEDRRVLMRDWIQAIRGGGNSIGSVEISTPLAAKLSLQNLRDLLQPADPRTVLVRSCPPQGLLSRLTGLWPSAPAQEEEPGDTLRRFSSLVSLRGTGGCSPYAAMDAINDAIKYYPWNQPHMTFARAGPLPIYQPSFPADIFGGASARGCGVYTMVGCTNAVVPYLRDLTQTISKRSPLVKARLQAGQGLLDEDMAEVEDVILTLAEQFEG